jgi:hypothetical protein
MDDLIEVGCEDMKMDRTRSELCSVEMTNLEFYHFTWIPAGRCSTLPHY